MISIVQVLHIFASAASVRCLRLCCNCSRSDEPLDDTAEFDAYREQLEQALTPSEDNAFRALRTAEFAMYYSERSDMLGEYYAPLCQWVQRTLPQLHGRGITEVHVYKWVAHFCLVVTGWWVLHQALRQQRLLVWPGGVGEGSVQVGLSRCLLPRVLLGPERPNSCDSRLRVLRASRLLRHRWAQFAFISQYCPQP